MNVPAGTTTSITITYSDWSADTTWRSDASTLPVRADTTLETEFDSIPELGLGPFLMKILILYRKLRDGITGDEVISERCPGSDDWRGNCELTLLDIADEEHLVLPQDQPRLLALAIFDSLRRYHIRTLNIASLRYLILQADRPFSPV